MQFKYFAHALFVALGLVPAGNAVRRVDANLERLRDLRVVSVGNLILDVPEEAYQCYGPCPEWEGRIAEAKEKAAEKLEKLADLAESAPAVSGERSCTAKAIDANIAALNDLEVVYVDGLIEAEPRNSSHVYRTEQTKCERAARLAGIVQAAKKGL